jgi:hypothetical protein
MNYYYVLLTVSKNGSTMTIRFKTPNNLFNLDEKQKEKIVHHAIFCHLMKIASREQQDSFILSGFETSIFSCKDEVEQKKVYKRAREVAGHYESN